MLQVRNMLYHHAMPCTVPPSCFTAHSAGRGQVQHQGSHNISTSFPSLPQLQEQMKSVRAAPAASVTRISKPSSSSNPQPHVHGPGCGHSHAHVQPPPAEFDLAQALQQAMGGILGEVKEHVAPENPPRAPSSSSANTGQPFPKAVHRKQSKFSLARKAKPEPAGDATSQDAQPAIRAGTLPASQPGGGALGSTGLVPSRGGSSAMDERAIVDAEGSRMLAAMSDAEVAEAQAELMARLSPEAVAFLKKRRQEKAAALAGSSGPSTSVQNLPSAAPHAHEQAHDGRLANRRESASAESHVMRQLTPAARLRFDVGGRVVGLAPRDQPAATAPDAPYNGTEVVSRDPVRQAEGYIPSTESYTVQEACTLARSTVPQQRALALRLLGSVIASSRPRGGETSASVPLPEAVSSELASADGGAVHWADVWMHLLHAANVTRVLRYALDDSNVVVVASAAEAIAALVCPCGTEQAALEAADANPLAGWPAPPLRHMQRPSGAGAWMASPLDLQSQREERRKKVAQTAAAGQLPDDDEAEGDVDEEELAKVDPMGGLLNMQLLQRMAYLLSTPSMARAAVALLSIVTAVALAGKDAADAAVRTPGLLAALGKILGASEMGGPLAVEAVFLEARPMALRALRALCQSSAVAARAAREAGLSRFVYPPLLLSHDKRDLTTLSSWGDHIEALRIWRCLGMHGQYLIHMDDVYPTLCSYLSPAWSTLSSLCDAPTPSASGEQLSCTASWVVAREAYLVLAQLCWHAARAGGGEEGMLSPECAKSIAIEATRWLAELPSTAIDILLRNLEHTCEARSGTIGRGGVHAAPAIALAQPPAALVMSSIAAALHFLGSYWATGDRSPENKDASSLATVQELCGDDRAVPILCAAASKTALETTLVDQQSSCFLLAAAAAGGIALCRLTQAVNQATAPARVTAMEPFLSPAAIYLLNTSSRALDATLLQPWDCPQLLRATMVARAIAVGGATNDVAPLDVALIALAGLAPGAEDTALQLLGLACSPRQVERAVRAAQAALCQQQGTLAPLASMRGGSGSHGDAAEGAQLPHIPSGIEVGGVLLAGYAATLLGLVQEEAPEGGGAEGSGKGLVASHMAGLLRPEGEPSPPVKLNFNSTFYKYRYIAGLFIRWPSTLMFYMPSQVPCSRCPQAGCWTTFPSLHRALTSLPALTSPWDMRCCGPWAWKSSARPAWVQYLRH